VPQEPLDSAAQGGGIDVEEIVDPHDTEWQDVERFWIDTLRFLGCRLTNLEDGGIRGKRMSRETREKMAASKQNQSEETRRKISEAKKGVKKSEETKAKMRAAAAHRSPEHHAKVAEGNRKHWQLNREKICARMRGRKLAPWACKAIGDRQRGKKLSPETVARIVESRRGYRHSPETIEKIRVKAQIRTSDPAWRAAHSAALMGRKLTPESIVKREATRRANWFAKQEAIA